MAVFCSLFSGSSGNCSYVENDGNALLIDAGVSARSISTALSQVGSSIGNIKGVFVTHEHIDHIRGLATLISKYKIPVYANQGTIRGILSALKNIDSDYINELATGETIECAGMCVSSFKTSHDSNESVGYRVQTADGKSAAVATDLGYVSETVMENITTCNVVMLESNHDVRMLQCGRYPYFLKRRILSDEGHLSNDDCASVLPVLVRNGAKHIYLAHLSEDNNFPELAVQTSVSALEACGLKRGSDYEIEAAPRFRRSEICCV